MEACAYAALGATYRLVQKYDKALGYHTQELEVYQELGNASGECQAHGHLAAVYMALGKYAMAFKSYEEQLELGQKLKDPAVEAQVYGNMGITKMNVGVMEEAIGYLEQQLATLQQLSGNEALMDRGRAYGNLGDCYEALGDFEEAIKYYDQYLSVAQSLNRMQDQEKAYRGLGHGHRFVSLLHPEPQNSGKAFRGRGVADSRGLFPAANANKSESPILHVTSPHSGDTSLVSGGPGLIWERGAFQAASSASRVFSLS